MRRKTVGGRRRSRTPCTTPSVSPIPLLSTPQDDHNATVFDSDGDDDHPPAPAPEPDFIPETEPPVDLFDDTICISCNEREGALLVCTESGCPVTVHASCIGSEPKFDDSGNFYCPYCWYKRALNNSRELREKAMMAKKALSSFLDEGKTVRKEEEEPPAEPVQDELKISDSEEGKEHRDNDKGKVSLTGSSVSETKDSDSEAISVKKGHAKRKVASSVKKSLLRERNSGDDVDEEEVTSSRTLRLRNQVSKHTSLTGGKRKRLLWTAEEEKALKIEFIYHAYVFQCIWEGVLKFSKENQNIPWRKILEFGCRVFDKTRTPADLKDKWKNTTSKEGCK